MRGKKYVSKHNKKLFKKSWIKFSLIRTGSVRVKCYNMLAAAKQNKFITLKRKDLRKMENENINTNATDTQMNSTNESKSESFANEALTANTNYGTISATDIENGTAELVLVPPFEGTTVVYRSRV